jgi:hypothetical protein
MTAGESGSQQKRQMQMKVEILRFSPAFSYPVGPGKEGVSVFLAKPVIKSLLQQGVY